MHHQRVAQEAQFFQVAGIHRAVHRRPPAPGTTRRMIREIEEAAIIRQLLACVRAAPRGHAPAVQLADERMRGPAAVGERAQQPGIVGMDLDDHAETLALGDRGAEHRAEVIVAPGELRGVPRLGAGERGLEAQPVAPVAQDDDTVAHRPVWELSR